MTVGQAIDRADFLCENAYDDRTKIAWLSTLDGMIHKNILESSEPFEAYQSGDMQRELLAEPPFDEMYVNWLLCKIYFANQEIEQYNNAATVYGEMYQQYARYHQRKTGTQKKVRFTNYRE